MLYHAIIALAATSSSVLALPALFNRQSSSSPADLCGTPNDSQVIPNTPWIVFNMMYNYQQIKGSVCTGFTGLVTGADGEQKCAWSSTWKMDPDSNPDTVKGYSFVGLTQNLENKISDIGSIPSTYHWVRSNTTNYKGNVVYDFMTSDTKGDSTSSNAQELMLWLRYEGGQVPIGWSAGPVATINNLYGKTWKLYQGLNTDTGITVSSLLVDPADQYYGWFEGDIKDWLMAMVNQGLFTASTYVNVGNAGMEPFYGDVSFQNKLGLQVNLA